MFELLVKNVVKHENLLILRLPALFGRYIKKNIIFDLLHKNQIDKINYNSYYQWYNLDKLVNDTSKNIGVTNKFRIVNLFPEPLHTSEILSIFNISKEEVDYMSDPVEYDYTVESMHDGYIESKENILEQIKVFIFNYIK